MAAAGASIYGDLMSMEAAYEVARRALRLADERRWHELVRLVDEDALEELREQVLQTERLREEHPGRKSHLQGMPEEIRKWHEEQQAKLGSPLSGLQQRFAVDSLEELAGLPPAELLVRQLRAGDPANRAKLMRPGPNAEPNEEVPGPPDERRIAIGIVAESEIIAHVLYRTHGPPSVMTTKLHTLTLRQAAEGWRAMPAGELFGHHGSFAMVHLGHVSGEASERAMPAVEQTPWLERSFPSGLAPGLLAALLGRFEGNLYRVMFMLGVPASVRTARPPRGGWSIQEHAGHLLELERLGEARLSEFERRTDVLSPADMSNRATMEGNYNARAPAEIMDELFKLRNGMIIRLRRLNREQLEHSALHPRLRQPMNVMDWVFFMCEHDDHHLARMRALNDEHWQRALSGSP